MNEGDEKFLKRKVKVLRHFCLRRMDRSRLHCPRKESIDDPYQFWGQIAKEFHWKVEPTKEDFVNYNFNVNDGPIKVCI